MIWFPSLLALIAGVTSVTVGGVIQGSVGIGLGLVAVPVLGFFIPDALPQVIVLASIPLMTAMVWHERHEFDLASVRWLVLGRFVGAAPAFVVLALVSDRALQMVIGVSTLLLVPMMAVRTVRIRVTGGSQFTAGALSGFTGTATGIGGATIALLYAHHRAETIRPTLALVMLLGSFVSMTGYGITGRLTLSDVGLAAALILPILVGLAIGLRVRSRLQGEGFRRALLIVVAVTAGSLVVRAAAG